MSSAMPPPASPERTVAIHKSEAGALVAADAAGEAPTTAARASTRRSTRMPPATPIEAFWATVHSKYHTVDREVVAGMLEVEGETAAGCKAVLVQLSAICGTASFDGSAYAAQRAAFFDEMLAAGLDRQTVVRLAARVGWRLS